MGLRAVLNGVSGVETHGELAVLFDGDVVHLCAGDDNEQAVYLSNIPREEWRRFIGMLYMELE